MAYVVLYDWKMRETTLELAVDCVYYLSIAYISYNIELKNISAISIWNTRNSENVKIQL